MAYTGWTAGVRDPEDTFLFSISSTPALGPTQPSIQWVPGALSRGVKRPGREANHSHPTSAEIKNDVCLINHNTTVPRQEQNSELEAAQLGVCRSTQCRAWRVSLWNWRRGWRLVRRPSRRRNRLGKPPPSPGERRNSKPSSRQHQHFVTSRRLTVMCASPPPCVLHILPISSSSASSF
jgi:hypothetical protein